MTEKENEGSKISLRDILFILFFKKYVFIGTFLLIVGGTVGYSVMVKAVYEVKGTVLIKPFVDTRQGLQSIDNLWVSKVSMEDITSEISIMKADELMKQVVQEMNLADQLSKPSIFKKLLVMSGLSDEVDASDTAMINRAVTNLNKRIEIKPITLSNMIEVSMQGNDPFLITEIVNTYLNLFIDHHIRVHKDKGGVSFFSKQSEFYEKKLEESEDNLKEFHKKWATINPAEQIAYNLELLKNMKGKASDLRGVIAENTAKVKALEYHLTNDGEIKAVTEEFRNNTVLMELVKAITPLLVEKERISLLYPPESTEYQDVDRQVKRFRSELMKEEERLVNGLKSDLAAMVEEERQISTEIDKIEKESQYLAQKQIEKNRLEKEVEQSQKIYMLYKDKIEEARIDEQKDSSRVANVSIIDWATRPALPIFPKKTLMALISLVVGFITGTGVAFITYFLDHTIKRPEDLTGPCGVLVFSALGKIE